MVIPIKRLPLMWFTGCLMFAFALGVPTHALAAPEAAPEREGGQTLSAFEQRVERARQQLPEIAELAEATAARRIANPEALINVPYSPQKTFAEEVLNRSGGLANALPTIERANQATEDDVLLFTLRSWEADWETARPIIADAREHGWLVVLFASAAGAPEDADYDFLIDNGAPDGSAAHARVNAIANALIGWLWVCEHAAALTRHGWHPGVLQSITVPGADEHNATVQRGTRRRLLHELPEGAEPIAAGRLAETYLAHVHKLIERLAGEQTQRQLTEAADTVAAHYNAGGRVAVSNATHLLLDEMFQDNRTPWEPFNVVWRARQAFPANLDEDDLIVWFSFIGLSTPYEDYGRYMRQTGAAMVTSYKTDERNPDNNAHDEALAHIEQGWAFGDAVVEVPFPPGAIAPISGLEQALIYRMLDEATANRINENDD